MESTLYNISQVLGITILHSLWQGLFIYFTLKIALSFGNRLAAATKYWLAVTSLLAITGWFLVTLFNEISVYNWLAVKTFSLTSLQLMQAIPAGVHQFNQQTIRYYYNIEGYLPYIAALYVIGLVVNSGRLIMARKKINSIKRNVSIDIGLQYTVNKFAGVLNIAKKVKIGLSQLVDVPCMTGFLKPVILLPFTIANYLSAEEIEAILLHELAHIKRNDYVVNIAQQVISILLFFNPCTLLINRIINEERENCCDDLVVKATADPMIYAKALLKLEQTRQNDWKLALAATGKKYHLLNRIERIMKTKKQIPSLRPTLLATLILTVGIGCIALLKPEIAEGKISVKAIAPIINSMLTDTGHRQPVKKTGTAQAHTVKKVHHTSPDAVKGDNDQKMNELNAEIQRHSEALNKYYNNEDFKKTEEEMQRIGQELQEFYNRPEVKRQQEELQRMSASLPKEHGDNGKSQKLTAQMGEIGASIGVYFKSPEFKRLDAEMRAKYGIPLEQKYNDDRDENYKKYEAELESKLPPEIKEKTEKLKTMGDEISARYNTPEFKETTRRMQELSDSIGKAYDNPEIKEKQKELERLGKQMNNWQNNPEMKKEEELLNQASKKMAAYVNSPQFKEYIESVKRTNFNYNFNFNNDSEKQEKADKDKKAEKDDDDNN